MIENITSQRLKSCSRCKEIFPIEMFDMGRRISVGGEGLYLRRSECKICRKKERDQNRLLGIGRYEKNNRNLCKFRVPLVAGQAGKIINLGDRLVRAAERALAFGEVVDRPARLALGPLAALGQQVHQPVGARQHHQHLRSLAVVDRTQTDCRVGNGHQVSGNR